MNNTPKRTYADLMEAWAGIIHPMMWARFQIEVVPHLNGEKLKEEISEEDYQFLLQKFREERPAFIRFILNYPCR